MLEPRGKHRDLTKTLVVEEGWVQKSVCDIVWLDEKTGGGCNEEEGAGKQMGKGPTRRRKIGSGEEETRHTAEPGNWEERAKQQTKFGSGKEESRLTLWERVNGRKAN